MDNQTFQKIKDLINQHQSVGVLVGPNTNLDEMAAGLGMLLVLKRMGKDASIVSPTDPVVGISSLVGIDKVAKSFSAGGNGDLTVSFPYKEGEIEKVSYTLDNGQLNIQVKAGPAGLNFQQQDVSFKRAGSAPSLVFTIGIPSLALVSGVFDPSMTTSIVNIDNKGDNQNYGDVLVVGTKFSSVSEQVADFVTLLEPQVELDIDICQNLLTGIMYATADFTSANTSYLAFEMCGILMKKGAKRVVAPTSQPNAIPNPSAFFPPTPSGQVPVQPMQAMQQPVQQIIQPQQVAQPQFNPAPIQPFDSAQGQQLGQQISQPIQQPVQSFVPPMNTQPFSAPQSQPMNNQAAPADWLTPKVYKGSTVL